MGKAHHTVRRRLAEKANRRTRRKAALMRLAAWYHNEQNRLRKLYARQFEPNAERRNEQRERTALINRMTNWQRNQWGRAGYPQQIDKLRHFVELPHWKARA